MAVILLSLGFTGNIIAYDYDNGIDTVTLTFNDTSTEAMIDDGNYSLTVNQTSITTFTVYADYIYTYDPNATYTKIVALTITSPNGTIDYLYAEASGEWLLEPIDTTYYTRGNLICDDVYTFNSYGEYEFYCEQWLLTNGSLSTSDSVIFTIDYDYGLFSDSDIAMGDYVMLEYGLGFIGAIGFVATPMITAKLMGSRNPMVVISASLICMIMFGTFAYVFLLGGA